MDQDKFCDLGNLDGMDTSEIDLTAPPTSGEAYLRQVIVGRSKCESIVVANRDFTRYTSKQTPQIPSELLLESLPESHRSDLNFPPVSWRRQQIYEFDHLRKKLGDNRSEILKKLSSKVNCPSIGNESGWKKFCFETCPAQFAAIVSSCGDKTQDLLKCHNGTPPLLPIIASLSHAQAVDLFEFHVAWFIDEGYGEYRMHWLYALMLLIEKPLTPEACSALRDLAREFARIRRGLTLGDSGNEEPMLRACNLFLCLIVDYFEQKDLMDW